MDIDYSNYELTVKEKYSFYVTGYICIFMISYLFYHSVMFSAFGGFLVVITLPMYRKWKAEKQRNMLLIQFKDMLYSLSSYVAANMQLSESLEGCLENIRLLYDEDSPLVKELKYMVINIRENKANDLQLLKSLADRSHCEDIENFVQVYSACIVTGGDLESVLKNTIEIIMDKITIEREIKTLTSQKRFEGNIITAMPLIVIMFLNLFSPEYLEPLYKTIAGRLIMTAALAGIVGAHFLTRRITKIEV